MSNTRKFSEIANTEEGKAVARAVWSAPAGEYQRSLLSGVETWSGSSLAGRAKAYGSKYAASRANLVERIGARLPSGWCATTEIVGRRRVLVLVKKDAPGQRYVW